MRIRKTKVIVLIVISILMLLQKVVYGATYTCNVAYPYQWEHGLYCSEPGRTLGYTLPNGWRSTEVNYYYKSYGQQNIEASTGYAYYVAEKDKSIGLIDSDMQSVIWKSDRWGNPSNVKDNNKKASNTNGKLYQRATQYGNAYYGILMYSIYGKTPVFKTTTNEKNLKALVDRNSGTYTVGPYKLVLNTKNNSFKKVGAQSLYNELKQSGNTGYNTTNAFAKFNINTDLTGINGSNFKFVNDNGTEIKFPNFVPGSEENFYIRFKPNNNGAITETGKPTIKIHFLNGGKFNGELIKGYAYNLSYKPGKSVPADQGSGGGNPGGKIPTQLPINFEGGEIEGIDAIGYYCTEGTDYYITYYRLDDEDNVIDTHKKKIGYSNKVIYRYRIKVKQKLPIGVNAENVEVAQYFMVELKEPVERTGGITSDKTTNSYSTYSSYSEIDGADESKKIIEEYPKSLTWEMIKNIGQPYIILWMDNIEINLSEDQFNADSINGWLKEYENKNYDFFNNMGWTYDERFDVDIDGGDFSDFGSNYYEGINSGSEPSYTSSYGVNTPSTVVSSKLQALVKVKNNHVAGNWSDSIVQLPGAPIDMQIGGTVWLENVSTNSNGRYTNNSGDRPFAGIQVKLYESNGNLVATTVTDGNGKYRFYGKVSNGVALINALKQYYVTFEYDGQRYQASYYKNDVANHSNNPLTYSNARETNRQGFNARFREISSSSQNYETNKYGTNTKGWYRAYGVDHKIANDKGNWVTTGQKNANGSDIALTYEDVYNQFIKLVTSPNFGNPAVGDNNKQWTTRTYYSIIHDERNGLKKWLTDKGVNNEFESIANFIMDSLVESSTQKDQNGSTSQTLYPRYSTFVLQNSYKERIESSTYGTMNTTMVKVNTRYLYSSSYDFGRFAGLGVESRKIKNDISLQKDVYKTTLIVNGKKEEYFYQKRDVGQGSNAWDSRGRVANELDNGTTKYYRDIRGSDYLFNAEDLGDNPEKNLQAYVTYRISYKNTGNVNVKVNEVVDYYDANEYENPVGTSVQLIKDNTYRGDAGGNNIGNISTSNTGLKGRVRSGDRKLKTETSTKMSGYNYEEVYITGMNNILKPGDITHLYITFKIKTEVDGKRKGKIRLDYSDNKNEKGEEEGDPYIKENPVEAIGKRNIAEINDYETIYPDSFKVPDYINNTTLVDKTITNGTTPGLIDYDSNPGSLSNKDLDENGSLIIEKKSSTITGKGGLTVKDRQEDDNSQSPNIIFRISITSPSPSITPTPTGTPIPQPSPENNPDVRKIKGYAFEDKRENESDETGGAAIGNGNSSNDETKINGVTVELVELVRDVDPVYQLSTGDYKEERIWASYTYDENDSIINKDESRYASGDGYTRIIINGTGIFKIHDTEGLKTNEDGAYVFKSFPAGDFFVRFKYGDTDDTTLMIADAAKEEAKNINQLDDKGDAISVYDVTKREGRNAKSYNGQDYKSTVYQKGIAQDEEYNAIKGFTDYGDNEGSEGQNYKTTDEGTYDLTAKNQMYYYNIARGDSSATVSDAKDVWFYRNRSNNYSKGADEKILLNRRAETLASFYKLASFAPTEEEILNNGDGKYYTYGNDGEKVYDYKKDYYIKQQNSMIDALEKNTYMVAQTGVINTEMEYNRKETKYQDDSLNYTIDNLNLGLTERPKAQLKLNKEVINYKIVMANGQELFNANKPVNNLAYSSHVQHYIKKENGLIPYWIDESKKEVNPRLGRPGDGNNELIQNYVDNEMLSSATLNVVYKLTVENVGEVDYIDKEFYYTGKENDKEKNISKTEAVTVIDYVPNAIIYEKIAQDEASKNTWNVSNSETITGTPAYEMDGENVDIEKEAYNLVNRLYYQELKTYKTILTTESEEALKAELKPGDSKETTLTLETEIKNNLGNTSLVYNNMAEIVATSNSVGRRCAFSIPGNEEMSDQDLGNNAASKAKSTELRINVSEVDADSAQKILIMPPTGKEANFSITKNNIIQRIITLFKR